MTGFFQVSDEDRFTKTLGGYNLEMIGTHSVYGRGQSAGGAIFLCEARRRQSRGDPSEVEELNELLNLHSKPDKRMTGVSQTKDNQCSFDMNQSSSSSSYGY